MSVIESTVTDILYKSVYYTDLYRMSVTILSIYRIAGNVCGNYILRFVVKSKVCRFNVCGLHNTSLLMHLHQKHFVDKN